MSDTWDKTIVLRKKPQKCKTQADINQAIATGNVVITKKKVHNKPKTDTNLAKIENSEALKVETIDKNLGKLIALYRSKLNFSQKDLANRICEKIQVISEYETGKGIPNNNVLAKLEKALNVKLRGSNIGSPLNG